VNSILILVLVSSAFFAGSMGSHYTGAVMGTAYGSGILSVRKAQIFAAIAAIIGSVVASINVIDTYANGLVPQASPLDIAAVQLSAAIVTTVSSYFKLPTSTIQIYTFSLLGFALVGGLPIHGVGFGLVILFWAVGPLLAFIIGFILAKIGLGYIKESVLIWFVIVVSIYSSFTLGSNDVSNAASSLVAMKLMPARMAGLYGGFFMLIGILTWGQRLLKRIGQDILKLDVPLAATAQLSQAITLSIINTVGYNASINQTIVGGLIGSGLAADRNKLNWNVIRNILMNWIWSPVLSLSSSVLITIILKAIFD
jgi:PiT family inorganic phosphate transporter